MKISKLTALWKLATGGFAGLAVYILEAVNKWLATLDQEKLARAASVVKSIANALAILIETFLPIRFVRAAKTTLDALNTLATALADGKITQAELDANIDSIEAAIEAWKELD